MSKDRSEISKSPTAADDANEDIVKQADTVSNAYISNKPALGRYVRRLLGSKYKPEDVDDFTQEVFVRAFADYRY